MHDTPLPKSRRRLSADGLIQVLRNRFAHVQDKRRSTSISYSMVDTLMAAFAMFSLKDPSLLAFQERQDDLSLKNLFCIDRIPSDTQMREILDVVEIDQLNECFADIFHELQRGVDQVQQACCPLFQAVLAKVTSRRSLWDRLRSAVLAFVFRSFRELFESVLTDRCRQQFLLPP